MSLITKESSQKSYSLMCGGRERKAAINFN